MSVKIQKPLAVISAVMMTMLLVVSTAVPVFAEEKADTTTDSNPQIVYEEPDLGETDATENYITLPDAPTKDGYIFKGWRVNGGSDLYNAGDVVVKDGNEEMHLQPVYEATASAKEDDNGASSATEDEPDILSEYEGDPDIVLQYGHDNILTLPDAKEKAGYKFYGWSLNGNTDLYDSGSTVPIKAGEKVTLRPVYVSTKEADDFFHKCLIAAGVCFVALLVFVRVFGESDSEVLYVFVMLWFVAAFALPVVGMVGGSRIMQQALADTLQQLKYMTP